MGEKQKLFIEIDDEKVRLVSKTSTVCETCGKPFAFRIDLELRKSYYQQTCNCEFYKQNQKDRREANNWYYKTSRKSSKKKKKY